ncbi:MAG TPA: gliding motility lipoprotein GldD [Bacteroidia bacterium]
MRSYIFIFFSISLLLSSCLPEEKEIIPKPIGYFRIVELEKSYQSYEGNCPFTFEYPTYAQITPYKKDPTKTCWFDVQFPSYNATLYMSYENIKGQDPRIYFEDSRSLVYSHTVKANGILEFPINDPERKVYGILYRIEGDAASNYQFHATDSVNHFLRGSLYFNARTNLDSITPALQFLSLDVDHLITTLNWK